MSHVLLAVQAVVAAPVVQQVPVVVHDTVQVVKTVPAHSAEMMKGAQLLLLFATGVGGSLFHKLIEAIATRNRNSGWAASVNVALQLVYGTLVAALASYITGELQLTTASGIDFATNWLIVIGSSQGLHMFLKWVDSFGADSSDASDPLAQQQAVSDAAIPQKASI